MFRWKRGALHGLFGFGLVVAGGLALFLATDPVDPEKAGEGVGRLSVFGFLAGLGISYLVQTKRKKAALGVVLALVAGIGAIVAVVATAPRARPLRAADRAPLVEHVVDGQPRLRHPTFGFSIARPPAAYKPSAQITAAMGAATQDPGTVVYGYAEDPPTGALVVTLMAGAGGSRTDFTRSIAGIRRGLADSMTQQFGSAAKLEILQDDVTGDDAHLEAHLHAVARGVHIQVVAHAIPAEAGHAEAIVSVLVISPDPATLADVLTSFQR